MHTGDPTARSWVCSHFPTCPSDGTNLKEDPNGPSLELRGHLFCGQGRLCATLRERAERPLPRHGAPAAQNLSQGGPLLPSGMM